MWLGGGGAGCLARHFEENHQFTVTPLVIKQTTENEIEGICVTDKQTDLISFIFQDHMNPFPITILVNSIFLSITVLNFRDLKG